MLCPANILGAMYAIHPARKGRAVAVRCHSERSVPRLWFCAKRRDTQSKNLSSMYRSLLRMPREVLRFRRAPANTAGKANTARDSTQDDGERHAP